MELERAPAVTTCMETKPIGPLVPARAGVLIVLAILAVLAGAWLLAPAFSGFHIGHDVWTDHECLSRVVQWCR
jgi:hypothetical protein